MERRPGDVRRRVRHSLAILKGLRIVAQHAAVKGAFEKGESYALRQYNRVLERLGREMPEMDLGLFEPLEEGQDGSQGPAELGIACTLLIRYLRDETGEEPGDDWEEEEPGEEDDDEDGDSGDGDEEGEDEGDEDEEPCDDDGEDDGEPGEEEGDG